MADEFKLPDIGEGLAEGEIVRWLVAVGDTVEEDQPLVEVMTDKATVEVPSPHAGTVAELRAAEGDIIAIGTTILVFGDVAADGTAAAPTELAPEAAAPAPAPVLEEPTAAAAAAETKPVVDERGSEVSADELEMAREVAKAERVAAESSGDRKPWDAPAIPGGAVAPAARRLAGELGVDVAQVTGTGPRGLVTKDDVRALASGDAVAAAPTAPAPEQVVATEVTAEPAVDEAAAAAPAAEPVIVDVEPPAARAEAPATEEDTATEVAAPEGAAPADAATEAAATEAAATEDTGPGAEERIPLRGLRRTIANRMLHATTTVPHYTYVEEVDMTEVVALRTQAKPQAAERGVKLTYLPFIIRALVLALQDHPYVNSMLDADAGEIVLKRYYNIGIATDTERGLMVPVLKDADQRDLFDLAAEITRLSTEAREGKIKLEDLQGGTFTISSTGNIGGLLATPVINVPEVAILGVTAIRERPVVRNGEIAIRHMVNLSMSCDHRVVDGAIAALFIRDLAKLLEDPKLQLLAAL